MTGNIKKISLQKVFNDVFGTEDKYFGEWLIRSDESLTIFLENLGSKDIFLKQLRYLFLYLESLEILKKQAVNKDESIANVFSKDIWYCSVLLLLIGLIDQHTQKMLPLNKKGITTKAQGERFKIVMNNLIEDDQKYMLQHYSGGKYEKFDEVTTHLYDTRNFFAHEIILPDGAIPQDGFLGFNDKHTNEIVIFSNMPHGIIFLSIVVALIRYLGFTGKMEISSNKKFDSFSDMLRHS